MQNIALQFNCAPLPTNQEWSPSLSLRTRTSGLRSWEPLCDARVLASLHSPCESGGIHYLNYPIRREFRRNPTSSTDAGAFRVFIKPLIKQARCCDINIKLQWQLVKLQWHHPRWSNTSATTLPLYKASSWLLGKLFSLPTWVDAPAIATVEWR